MSPIPTNANPSGPCTNGRRPTFFRTPVGKRRTPVGKRRTAVADLRTVVAGGAVAGLCLATLLSRGDGRLIGLGWHTAGFALGATFVALPLGTLLALLLFRTEARGRTLARWLLLGLLFLPVYFHASAWSAGLGRLAGGDILRAVIDRDWVVQWVSAVWIQGLSSTAWVVLILAAGLELVEPELEEQAMLDGTWWQVATRVTLPGCRASWLVAAWWVVVMSASDMTVTNLYQIRTLAEEIYTRFALDGESSLLAGWQSIGLLVGILVGGTMAVIGPAMSAARHLSLGRRRAVPLAGRSSAATTLLLWLIMLLLVGVPLISLAGKTGLVVESEGGIYHRSWSAARMLAAVVPTPWTCDEAVVCRFGWDFGWSLAIGAGAASVALVISLPLAWLAWRGGIYRVPAIIVASVSLAVPGPLVAQLIVGLFSARDWPLVAWLFDRTLTAPVLAESIRAMGVLIWVCWTGLRPDHQLLVESAQVDGAGPLRTLWHTGVRPYSRWLGTAWLIGFLLAATDLATTILVVPPGVITITMRLFDFLHAGSQNEVGAICLTIFVSVVVVVGLLNVFHHRRSPKAW